MKKFYIFRKLVLSLLALAISGVGLSQLPNGSIAPNWTMTDINSNSHTLYNYLAQGKKVVIDVSAVWCAPCWSYHQTSALKNLYNQYGPTGSVNQTMMVFFIEGDENPLACLQGTGCSTQGNWVTGTPYPMFLTNAPPAGNGNSVVGNYDIAYFPTVYTVCPDHTIYESGQKTTSQHYSYANSTCAPLSTTVNDVKAFSSTSPSGSYCVNSVSPNLTIQNYGTANLTSCTIQVRLDGNLVQTINWTGNLTMYSTAVVSVNPVTSIADGSHTLQFQLSNPNGQTDENSANNTINKTFSVNSNGAIVSLDLLTDNYPGETTWELFPQGSSTPITSGGSYTSTQHHYLEDWCLTPGSCYTFKIYDSYGDGMSYGGVTGSVTITYNGNTLVTFLGSTFTTSKTVDFCVPQASGIDNNNIGADIRIFPNPSSGMFYITNAENSVIELTDILGKVVLKGNISANNEQVNLSNLPDGSYILRISKTEGTVVKNIVLVK